MMRLRPSVVPIRPLLRHNLPFADLHAVNHILRRLPQTTAAAEGYEAAQRDGDDDEERDDELEHGWSVYCRIHTAIAGPHATILL